MSGGDEGGAAKDRVAGFNAFRARMNERILAEDNHVIRRFFSLDTQAYRAGALDVKTKELLGQLARRAYPGAIALAGPLPHRRDRPRGPTPDAFGSPLRLPVESAR